MESFIKTNKGCVFKREAYSCPTWEGHKKYTATSFQYAQEVECLGGVQLVSLWADASPAMSAPLPYIYEVHVSVVVMDWDVFGSDQ